MFITCLFVFNSLTTAQISLHPSFQFEYTDGTIPPPYYTYNIQYGIENTNNTNGSPWGLWTIGTSLYYPPNGVLYIYYDYTQRTIYLPTPEDDLNCFRIFVKVTRSDGTIKWGYSAWTDQYGLANGLLKIIVNPF